MNSAKIILGTIGLLAGAGLLAAQTKGGSKATIETKVKAFDTLTKYQRGTVRGAILYEGPSQFDGKPIVVIIIYKSSNPKTNDIPQAYIIRQDIPPTEARRSGDDVSICGNCAFRSRGCYVNPMGVLSIWKSYQAGKYSDWAHVQWWLARNAPRVLRAGAYGDPVAAPVWIWDKLNKMMPKDATLLSYTEQWRSRRAQAYRWFCMASVKSYKEQLEAKAKGWRTFRIYPPEDAELAKGQIICPYEATDTVTCLSCGLCDGGEGPDIANPVHGSKPLLKKALHTLREVKRKEST